MALGVCLVLAEQAYEQSRVEVVVYNNSGHFFPEVDLGVGTENCEAGALAAGESLARNFRRGTGAQDLKLYVELDKPLQWHAPALLRWETGRIILHVDPSGAVQVTQEPALFWRLWSILN